MTTPAPKSIQELEREMEDELKKIEEETMKNKEDEKKSKIEAGDSLS